MDAQTYYDKYGRRAKVIALAAARRTGYDPDDAVQEGYLRMLRAARCFDGRGTAEGYVSRQVSLGVRDVCRRPLRRGRRHGSDRPAPRHVALTESVPAPPRFPLGVWLADLPADARTAALMALDGAGRGAVRAGLRAAGWTAARVARAFDAVADALS